MSDMTFTINDDKKTLVITRTFAAPKHRVWAAYTVAEQIEQWWGPVGWKTTVKELNLVPGGEWLYCMTCMDKNQTDWYGKDSCGKGVYDSIEPEDVLAYTDYFTDAEGTVTPGMPVSRTKLLFAEAGGRTTITSITTYDTEAELTQVLAMGMQEGFEQTWNNLEGFLATQ